MSQIRFAEFYDMAFIIHMTSFKNQTYLSKNNFLNNVEESVW